MSTLAFLAPRIAALKNNANVKAEDLKTAIDIAIHAAAVDLLTEKERATLVGEVVAAADEAAITTALTTADGKLDARASAVSVLTSSTDVIDPEVIDDEEPHEPNMFQKIGYKWDTASTGEKVAVVSGIAAIAALTIGGSIWLGRRTA